MTLVYLVSAEHVERPLVGSTPRTACMAISMVGDRCSQRSQQGAVINILDKTTTEFGWSTDLARKHLLDSWGWPTRMEE
ncbi:hypothetical protein NW759_010622 [Fusarium solani]|nr:hypothetical protein NW759_010622 [Fusarium solani]